MCQVSSSTFDTEPELFSAPQTHGVTRKCSKSVWMWHLGSWCSGGLGSTGLNVEFDDPRGLFQPQKICNSMSLWPFVICLAVTQNSKSCLCFQRQVYTQQTEKNIQLLYLLCGLPRAGLDPWLRPPDAISQNLCFRLFFSQLNLLLQLLSQPSGSEAWLHILHPAPASGQDFCRLSFGPSQSPNADKLYFKNFSSS